jgi:hypothetical protein
MIQHPVIEGPKPNADVLTIHLVDVPRGFNRFNRSKTKALPYGRTDLIPNTLDPCRIDRETGFAKNDKGPGG